MREKFGRFLRRAAKSIPDSAGEILDKKNIILNCKPVTLEEAIQACGRLLLDSGCIEPGYIQAMLERETTSSVAIGSHVAIPHSDNEARRFVKKTGLAVMTYPDGIDWNGACVRLVIGIASKGEDHLEILNRIAAIAVDEETTDKLVDDADLNALYASLNDLNAAKITRPLLEERNIVLNCKPVSPEEAIEACGRLMVESGYVSEDYIQDMLERNANFSVAIGSHVAIPHGTNKGEKLIKRIGLVVMTYPDGIQWGDELVRLVIGIALQGEDHLDILARIAEAAGTEEDTDSLVDRATAEEWYKALNS